MAEKKKKKNWAQKLKSKVKEHFTREKSVAKKAKPKPVKKVSKAKKKQAKLDIKRKNSRRGRQRAALKDSGMTPAEVDRMLPWGK